MPKLSQAASIVALAMTTYQAWANPQLNVVAESATMIWNAVAVDQDQVYVAGPRWTGSKGESVARLDRSGKPQPYPDETWNAWQEGADPSHAFVDVNAIRLDGRGSLWVVDTGSPTFGGIPLPGGAKLVQISLATSKVTHIIALGPDKALKDNRPSPLQAGMMLRQR